MRLQNNRYSFLSYAYDHSYYLWGLDLSGQSGGRASPQAAMQGAGGVGGLLAVIQDGQAFMPCYDANGNVTEYVNGNNGSTAARYRYDAFGNTLAQSGPMAPNMTQRFSTKYYDGEYLGTDMYYYGFRIYAPRFHRWLSTDPIGEKGGLNLYGFCGNDPINKWDYLGMFWGCCQAKKTKTYKPVMVAIFLSRIDSGAEIDTEPMMTLLRNMDNNLKWDLNAESLPAGAKVGDQKNKIYKETCYEKVYFVEAGLFNTDGTWPFGGGDNFSAWVWANRVKYKFYEQEALGELTPEVVALGPDLAWHRIGGFFLTHEIIHSVGITWHTEASDSTSVMVAKPLWTWIFNPPRILPDTVTKVKNKLGVKP